MPFLTEVQNFFEKNSSYNYQTRLKKQHFFQDGR